MFIDIPALAIIVTLLLATISAIYNQGTINSKLTTIIDMHEKRLDKLEQYHHQRGYNNNG